MLSLILVLFYIINTYEEEWALISHLPENVMSIDIKKNHYVYGMVARVAIMTVRFF